VNKVRAIGGGLAAGALIGGAVVALAGADGTAVTRPETALPAAPQPALAIPSPRALRGEPYLTRWAPLRHPTAARAAPTRSGPVVARLAARTPEGTPHPLPVLGHATDGTGRLWLRVRLPVLPNGTVGWVPRTAVGGYQLVRHRLVVDLGRHRATLLLRGRRVFAADIGVGGVGTPTPRGRFLVRNRLERYASPQYGPVAFGTSARSPTLTDWPAGGFVGIHGTDQPAILPGDVSHGCIRMRNRDILQLAELMPVGTPVVIR
jgi:lipoprotein-anchoring transpeptidase ErfK/SrfK